MALEPDRVTLSVTSPDNGTAAEEVPADYKSAGFEIGFNANYLKDILGQIDGDTVELHLADAGAPTLIRQDDKSAGAVRADADAGLATVDPSSSKEGSINAHHLITINALIARPASSGIFPESSLGHLTRFQRHAGRTASARRCDRQHTVLPSGRPSNHAGDRRSLL